MIETAASVVLMWRSSPLIVADHVVLDIQLDFGDGHAAEVRLVDIDEIRTSLENLSVGRRRKRFEPVQNGGFEGYAVISVAVVGFEILLGDLRVASFAQCFGESLVVGHVVIMGFENQDGTRFEGSGPVDVIPFGAICFGFVV